MNVPKPKKVNVKEATVVCVAVGTTVFDVKTIWGYAHQYQSWELGLFMAQAPSPRAVKKARRVVELLTAQ